MSEQVIGKITVVGSDAECALVAKAFSEGQPIAHLPASIPEMLKAPLQIEWHSQSEFLANGWIVPGSKSKRFPKGKAAWGYRVSKKLLVLNSDQGRKRPVKMKHVSRHEVGHDVDGDFLNKSKRAEIMAGCMVNSVTGKAPTQWAVPKVYEDASEGFADGFAVAISSIESVFDYDVEVVPEKMARLLEIVFRPDPVVEPPPPPEPTPPDPNAELVAEIARLNALLAEVATENHEIAAQSLATANKAQSGGSTGGIE